MSGKFFFITKIIFLQFSLFWIVPTQNKIASTSCSKNNELRLRNTAYLPVHLYSAGHLRHWRELQKGGTRRELKKVAHVANQKKVAHVAVARTKKSSARRGDAN